MKRLMMRDIMKNCYIINRTNSKIKSQDRKS